jgi:hypothetical protein
MNVKRCEFSDAPIDLIDRLAGNCFFSSTTFASLWGSLGGTPVYWIAEAGEKIVSILPGVEFGRKMLRSFQSMPNGCYARFLYAQAKHDDSIAYPKQIVDFLTRAGYAKVYINDFYNSLDNSCNYGVEQCATYLVDISSPDWEPPDSKLRQQIHKAQRERLQIEPFNASRHMVDFMKLVRLHERRRKTTSRYTQEFFEMLAEFSYKDDRIQWLWCEHDTTPVASSIFFREGNAIIHWQMYYDEAMSHHQATKLIPHQAAKNAQTQGIIKLNLGASPSDAEGAEFYKSKWGGEKYAYNCYVHKSFLGKLW